MQYTQKNPEKQKEDNERKLEEDKEREERRQKELNDKNRRKKITYAIIIIVLIFFGYLILNYIFSPGKYDEFAKCLTEKGAVMYGEDWCPYTQGQKTMFGKSFKYINYEVKTGLNLRPTWVIDGKTYERVQSFQRLSELTGCKFN